MPGDHTGRCRNLAEQLTNLGINAIQLRQVALGVGLVALRIGAIRLDQSITNIGDVDLGLLQVLPSVRVVIAMIVVAMVIMGVLFFAMPVMVVIAMIMMLMRFVPVVIMAMGRKRPRNNAVGGGDHWAAVVAGVNQALHPALKQQAVEDH